MNKPDKGQYKGSCNRSACQKPYARWYNRVTQAYYCLLCARLLNKHQNPSFPDMCISQANPAHPHYDYQMFVIDVCADIGELLYQMGKPYGASSCIADYTTFGYGHLDFNGFWQFNIPSLESKEMPKST